MSVSGGVTRFRTARPFIHSSIHPFMRWCGQLSRRCRLPRRYLVWSLGSVARSRWQVFRLYFTPFCVSSYVALTNGLGFVLVFPSDVTETLQVLAPCLVLLVAAVIARRRRRSELSYEL